MINTNSQSNDAASVEVAQQPTQPNLLPTRMQAPHFHHSPHIQQQTTASFEEYETPPRLRRSGPIPSGGGGIPMGAPAATHRPNQRHHFHPHRQMLNGRGIMGQGPKSHRVDQFRLQTAYPPPM